MKQLFSSEYCDCETVESTVSPVYTARQYGSCWTVKESDLVAPTYTLRELKDDLNKLLYVSGQSSVALYVGLPALPYLHKKEKALEEAFYKKLEHILNS